uniref:VWFD domain-containing protein n=1 Tax=Ascaris lumbricoides TaxID=6252 RepID=A0A0M3HTP8_ASCLU
MAYQRDCVDLECERTTFDKTITELSDANGTTEQCRGCQHCTINGYSVCVRLRESALRARRAPDETVGVCGCAHNIPKTCDTKPTRQKPNNASTRLFNICYLSALQSPPRPQAENRQSSVIVTIEPFWLQPYWRELRLSNLTMHYEFPVTHPENCDGDALQVTADGQNNICSANLQIEMSESEAGNAEADVEDQFADNFYEDDGVSEVQFDRAVFAGAENVKFWYSVYVERPRQLNPRRTDSAVVDVHSVIDSGNLEFDLETSIYGFGDSQNGENFPGDVVKWKEEGNGNAIHMNANDIGGERSLVAMENAAEFEHVQKEKTAEEVAKEVDFFAADDESRPVPEGGDEEPIAAEASSDEYSNTDTSFEEESEQKESSAELSIAKGGDEADADFRENLIDEMDNAQSDSKVDESRIYATADRRFDELSGEDNGKNGQIDGDTDEEEGNEGTRTESYGISAFENDEERRASFSSDDTLADDDTSAQSATMSAEKEDAEEMMSNEEHRKNSDEAMRKILQQDRERAHRRFELTTLSTAAGRREQFKQLPIFSSNFTKYPSGSVIPPKNAAFTGAQL